MYKFNLLVVDDEQDLLKVIGKRLEKMGVKVVIADSGKRALEIVESMPIDVVLLDVKMPDMDGIETLRRIRILKPQVEVVLLSGHASVESGIEGMSLGAFDYLMKPIDLEVVLEKLADAYERKRLHQERIGQAENKRNMAKTS